MSSFGGPGQRPTTKPTPPQRGSFPLDHDGECRDVMTSYLSCIKRVKGVNEAECRDFAKAYLACRMDRNLMARDDFKNLGFNADDEKGPGASENPKDDGKKLGTEKVQPGELRW